MNLKLDEQRAKRLKRDLVRGEWGWFKDHLREALDPILPEAKKQLDEQAELLSKRRQGMDGGF